MKRLVFAIILVVCVVLILLVRQRQVGEEFAGVTLKFSFWGGETEVKAVEEICRAFEATHPGIRISTEPLPWGDYWLKMKTRASSNAGPPDVLRMTSLFGAEWSYNGLLLDLAPYVARDNVDLGAFFSANVDACSWQGRLHSMPTDAAVRVLMYNKDLFDRAGLPYPSAKTPMTWAEFRDVARRLTVAKDGAVVQYGLSLGYMEYQAFVAQAGAGVVDNVSNPRRMTVNTPDGTRALDFYAGLIVRDKVSPATRQQQNLGFGAPDWALQSGNVAMQHGGTWSLPDLATKPVGGRPLRFGLAPVPRDAKRSQVAFTNSCGIWVKSRHKEEAWQFLKFLASAEGQRLVGERGVGIPVLRDVARSDAFLKEPHGVENMDVFLDELECAETNVCAPTSEWRNAMEKIVFDQLCLGTIDAREAARRMESEGNRILAMERVTPTAATGIVVPALLFAALALAAAWLIVRARRRHYSLSPFSGGEGKGEGSGLVPAGTPPHPGPLPLKGERGQKSENLAGYLFIAPWLVGLVLFALGPVLLALGASLTDWNIFHEPRYVGAANYAKVLAQDPEFWTSLKVTLVYALTSIPIQLAGGLLCAMLLNLRGVRFAGFFRTVLYLPYLFTGVAIALVWRSMYADTGVVNHMLKWCGIVGPDWLLREGWALPAMVLMNFTWLGGNMIIFLAALQGVPQSLYDAAQVDGAGPVRRFWHVTLPMTSPAMLFNLVMGTIWSFQVFAVPRIMTDGGPNDSTLFYVLNLYRRAFQYNEMGYACALAFLLFIIIFIVSFIELRGSRRWVHYEGGG